MVDNGISMRCRLVALAEALDQLSGIENFSGIAVELNLQKLWTNLTESSVRMALQGRFGWLDGVKLDLERRFERPVDAKVALQRRFCWPYGVKLALGRRLGRPDGAKLALERRFSRPVWSLERRWGRPSGRNPHSTLSILSTARSPDRNFMDRC